MHLPHAANDLLVLSFTTSNVWIFQLIALREILRRRGLKIFCSRNFRDLLYFALIASTKDPLVVVEIYTFKIYGLSPCITNFSGTTNLFACSLVKCMIQQKLSVCLKSKQNNISSFQKEILQQWCQKLACMCIRCCDVCVWWLYLSFQ